jgi:hypothetical protein
MSAHAPAIQTKLTWATSDMFLLYSALGLHLEFKFESSIGALFVGVDECRVLAEY